MKLAKCPRTNLKHDIKTQDVGFKRFERVQGRNTSTFPDSEANKPSSRADAEVLDRWVRATDDRNESRML